MADWENQYRVIAPDLLGYGDTSPWREPRALSLDDEVELVAAVIIRAGCAVHLVGHSYGGAVALHTAMVLGSRVASLSLVEPTAFYLLSQAPCAGSKAADAIAEITGVAHDIGESLAAGFPMAAAHRFVDYWCGPGAWARMPSERRWRTSSQMQKVQQDFHALLTNATEIVQLATINVPTLILCGTASPRPVRHLSRVITEAIPSARHRTIPNAGHMMPLTHADVVNELIAEHMAGAVGRSENEEAAVLSRPPGKAAFQVERPAPASLTGGMQPVAI